MSPSAPTVLTAAQANAVEKRFRSQLAGGSVEGTAPHPDTATIETVVNRLFWASLYEEEGRVPRVSVAFLPPELAVEPVVFKQRLPFIPREVARLGPAVEGAGIHLAIWGEAGGLYVWGIVSRLPDLTFIVEVAKPGLLVIKHSRSGVLVKFGNIAVLEGDRFKLADESAALRPDCPPLVEHLLRPDLALGTVSGPDVLIQLALAMRTHGQGGLLLMVPAGSETWRESLVWPAAYSLNPPFTRLSALLKVPQEEKDLPAFATSLQQVVGDVAGLTAVDGAVVMTEDFEVRGFGVTVERAADSRPVERLVLSEPFSGGDTRTVAPGVIGNTRHLAAAQYIHDQREGTALVASQDGPFTVFTFCPEDELVHVHRIDGLLL